MIGPLRRPTVDRMPCGAGEEPHLTYLAEHISRARGRGARAPGCSGTREHCQLELEGKQVRYLRATIVPGDESFLLALEAASEELVREAYARAGVRFDRSSTTLEDEAFSVAASSPSGTDPRRTV
jgi:hypothetical protein